MFLGFLKSKNLLSKASAIWIMIYLVFLYPSTVTSFTLSYILLWISIGICYTKQVREMSDDEIKGKIFDVEAVKLNNETKDHFYTTYLFFIYLSFAIDFRPLASVGFYQDL